MAKKRAKFTIESNLDKIMERIEEKPHRVLNEIGLDLVKEIRPQLNTKKSWNAFTRVTLQYWARREEKDLIIGHKDPMRIRSLSNAKDDLSTYQWLYDEVDDPILPTVRRNIPNIQKMIGKALDEIRKE